MLLDMPSMLRLHTVDKPQHKVIFLYSFMSGFPDSIN